MAGLRERKKAEAMRHIQRVAVELFQERGFDRVTVQEVAEAATTSASSIYRYFGTKEGLVLHDEFDDVILEVFSEAIRHREPFLAAASTALQSISRGHFVRERESTLARFRLWVEHPGIQMAAARHLDMVSEQVAELLVETGEYSRPAARFIAAATVHGFIAAIKTWFEDGGEGSAEAYVEEGIAALGRSLSMS